MKPLQHTLPRCARKHEQGKITPPSPRRNCEIRKNNGGIAHAQMRFRRPPQLQENDTNQEIRLVFPSFTVAQLRKLANKECFSRSIRNPYRLLFAVSLQQDCLWAGRSAWYDRHVGIVEAPGSNPGPSTIRLSRCYPFGMF